MSGGIRKFTFDQIFTPDGRVLTVDDDQRTFFRPEEVAQARRDAYAEGERSATAQAEHAAAAALEAVAAQLQTMRSALEAARAQMRRDAFELALAAARAAAGSAIARFPEEEIAGVFAECLDNLRAAPVVVARVPPEACETVAARLSELAERAGLEAAIRVEPGDGPARIEWNAGSAEIDPEFALARAREAAERWLKAQTANDDQPSLFSDGEA